MKNLKNIFAVVASALAIAGCGNNQTFGGQNTNAFAPTHYTVDPNTGLCFSEAGSSMQNNYSHTWVPCTQEVVALLPADQRSLAREVVPTQPVRSAPTLATPAIQ
jgi:hypothetical protein